MKPLLAHVYEPHRVSYPCFVQPKLNGIRALYKAGHFQSRDQLPFPRGLLDHLARPLLEIFGDAESSPVLDGELYVHGWPLQRINAAVTPVRQKPTEDTLKVEYHVFDRVDYSLPFANIGDLMIRKTERGWTQTYKQSTPARLTCLYVMAADAQERGNYQLLPVPTYVAHTEDQANDFYAKWVSGGFEGMMYRLGDCPYTIPKQLAPMGYVPRNKFMSDQNNRCWHLLKRKDWQDDEFICVAVIEGEGKLKGTLGALRCSTNNQFPDRGDAVQFSVGSGLTDAERDHYWQNPPIGRLVKVKYLVLSQDQIPLNPTILAVL